MLILIEEARKIGLEFGPWTIPYRFDDVISGFLKLDEEGALFSVTSSESEETLNDSILGTFRYFDPYKILTREINYLNMVNPKNIYVPG